MSFAVLNWAAPQDAGNMAAKMVLLALANWADDQGRAFPSIAALAAFGNMDAKTVIAALARLEAMSFVSDTGERRGRTRQIKVYALNLERQPDHSKAPESGTLPKTEAIRKRNPSVFSGKGTQKRVTDTITDTVIIDAIASIGEEPQKDDLADQPKPEHFVEIWNALAARLGKPAIRTLTPERRQKLKARMAEYSVADFKKVLASIERSQFLREGRWMTFDWIIGKANFLKVLEGNYDR